MEITGLNSEKIKVCSHVTFAFPSTFQFNLVPVLTQTQRMGVLPFFGFCVPISFDITLRFNATLKLTQMQTLSVNKPEG